MGLNWLSRLLRKKSAPALAGQEFRIAFCLLSNDGKREVEVRKFGSGVTYVVERDWIEGAFADRHDGTMVGPFASPKDAERFITATAWFRGDEMQSI